MSQLRSARTRGHEIQVWIKDDGDAAVTVDGEDVPVRVVDGGFAVAYLAPNPDLLEAARQYARRLAQGG
jgi:hypothetical protein